MNRPKISPALRERVASQAQYRCGYCLTAAFLVGTELELDHLLPRSRGGTSDELNLWLACSDCNDIKSDRVFGVDPATSRRVRLFNPRMQSWDRHFAWLEGGALIAGKTATGRATVETLRLNRAALVRSRRVWIIAGLHPPAE
jgi:5-methylcytosine-specific restriction endonuclease McrA